MLMETKIKAVCHPERDAWAHHLCRSCFDSVQKTGKLPTTLRGPERIAAEENAKQLGRRVEVLVTAQSGRKSEETHRLSGRSEDQRLVHFSVPEGAQVPRPGDFVTVTQSKWHGNSFAGFGYFSKKDSKVGLKVYQEPYHVLFARKSQA